MCWFVTWCRGEASHERIRLLTLDAWKQQTHLPVSTHPHPSILPGPWLAGWTGPGPPIGGLSAGGVANLSVEGRGPGVTGPTSRPHVLQLVMPGAMRWRACIVAFGVTKYKCTLLPSRGRRCVHYPGLHCFVAAAVHRTRKETERSLQLKRTK